MSAEDARAHYNARPQIDVSKRKESKIIQLKNFNNWIKSILIQKYVEPQSRVLDFCCGKGGDLLKWTKAEVAELTGVDIADVSISHARQRYEERRQRFPANFYALDCFSDSITSFISPTTTFDVVSCQFALHYSFESESRARKALENITCRLRSGGYFIGTVPDSNRIVKRLREKESNQFGNSIFNITFESRDLNAAFGQKYIFELSDAIDNCPEYLFHFSTFQRLASEVGLDLVYKAGFHEMFVEEHEKNLMLLYKMNVVNEEGSISPDEWEAIGLYLAFAFRKR